MIRFVCVKPERKLYILKDEKKYKVYNCAIGGGADVGGNGASENGYQKGGVWNDYLTPLGKFKLTKWVNSKDDIIVTIDNKKYNIWKRKIHLNCKAINPETNSKEDKGIRIHSCHPDLGSEGMTHGCIRVSKSDLIDIWNTIEDKSEPISIHITTALAQSGDIVENSSIEDGMENSSLNFVSPKNSKNI